MRERSTGIGSKTRGGSVATAFLATLLGVSTACGVPGGSPPTAATTDGDDVHSSTHEPSSGEEQGRQAVLERARQRGALFYGTGNEPGWNVEIGPTQTIFITAYGAERYEFVTSQPVVDRQNHRTTYQTRFDGHEIVVELTDELCGDTMSDETFPLRVRIELDGSELRGCGVALTSTDR